MFNFIYDFLSSNNEHENQDNLQEKSNLKSPKLRNYKNYELNNIEIDILKNFNINYKLLNKIINLDISLKKNKLIELDKIQLKLIIYKKKFLNVINEQFKTNNFNEKQINIIQIYVKNFNKLILISNKLLENLQIKL